MRLFLAFIHRSKAQGAITLVNEVTTQQVAAQVSYDQATKKAMLDPNDNLDAGTAYGATIKGGDNGVNSAAGTPLEADRSGPSRPRRIM